MHRRDQILGRMYTFLCIDPILSNTFFFLSISPYCSFIFLQLYYSPMTSAVTTANKEGSEAGSPPLLVPNNIHTAIKNLDRIPPYETHKIGVLYVGRGQAGKEAEILANEHGSVRYMEFLHKLGQLISLNEVDTRGTYIGGLEVSGEDGKFAYLWKDDVLQVIFHVATLMPTKLNDPACTNKKRHIGNNYVTIVYNDSGEDHQMNTIRVSFLHVVFLYRTFSFHSFSNVASLIRVNSIMLA